MYQVEKPENLDEWKTIQKNHTMMRLPSINEQLDSFTMPVGFIVYIDKQEKAFKRLAVELKDKEEILTFLKEYIDYSFDKSFDIDVSCEMCSLK